MIAIKQMSPFAWTIQFTSPEAPRKTFDLGTLTQTNEWHVKHLEAILRAGEALSGESSQVSEELNTLVRDTQALIQSHRELRLIAEEMHAALNAIQPYHAPLLERYLLWRESQGKAASRP